MKLRPALTDEISKQPFSRDWNHAARLIRNGIQHDAVSRKDHETLHHFLCDYWAAPVADEFFDGFGHRFEDIFLRHHAGIVDEIAKVLQLCGTDEVRLVELGSGDGRVLKHLSDHLPGISHFVGIDLNEPKILECREKNRDDSRLSFVSEDVVDWLKNHPADRTVLFTNGGVLEYFTRSQLLGLFKVLRQTNKICFASHTETFAIDHDLESEAESFPYGHELAFSHNYHAILREAGFEVSYENDRFTVEGEEHHPSRWFQVLAKSL
jgi:hypothetical protein